MRWPVRYVKAVSDCDGSADRFRCAVGSEVILEGVIEGRKREIEGPFSEFTGHYSGKGAT